MIDAPNLADMAIDLEAAYIAHAPASVNALIRRCAAAERDVVDLRRTMFPDDSETITKEWLKGETANFSGNGNRIHVYTGYSTDFPNGVWCVCINGSTYACSVRVFTRGQLRRLCRELGIEGYP